MTVPPWKLERYRLGELSEAERRAVEADLGEALSERLAELDADDAQILRRYPARVMAAAIEEKASAQRRRAWMPVLAGGGVLAATAAAILIAVNVPVDPGVGGLGESGYGVTDDGGNRAKGDDRVLVFREAKVSGDPVTDGASAQPGERFQVGMLVEDPGFAVIVSLDGRGVVTRHLPADGGDAAPVGAGRAVLPTAYELDDAPDFERFFLVTSNERFGVQPVEDAVRALASGPRPATAPLVLPQDLAVHSLTLRKVTP